MEPKIDKTFFVFQITGFELGVANSQNLEQDTKHSDVNVLKNTPKISPNTRGEIFQINFPENDEKHQKNTLMGISQICRTLSHVHCQTVFWNRAF